MTTSDQLAALGVGLTLLTLFVGAIWRASNRVTRAEKLEARVEAMEKRLDEISRHIDTLASRDEMRSEVDRAIAAVNARFSDLVALFRSERRAG